MTGTIARAGKQHFVPSQDFGGEVPKSIGDGVLAIFPSSERRRAPPAMRLCARCPPLGRDGASG